MPRSRYDAGILVALLLAVVALALAVTLLVAQPAEAARHWAYTATRESTYQRAGLVVRPAFHGSYGVRIAATVHFARIRGRLYARASGAIAGYDRHGRRPMQFAGSIRGSMGGRGSAATRRTNRLVVRSGWVRVRGVQATRARVVFWVTYPDRARARYVLRSRAGVGTG